MRPIPARTRQPERLDVRRVAVVGVLAVVGFAAVGAGAWAVNGDVPRGTRVLGIDLGGRSRADAERLLRDRVAGHAADPVRVRLDGRYLELAAAKFCLRVDVGRTVDRAIRGGARLGGHRDVSPVVRLDRNRLEAALRARIDPARVTMRRPGITFAGLTPEPSYPEPGLDLDPGAARAVRAAWPVGAVAAAQPDRTADRSPPGRTQLHN